MNNITEKTAERYVGTARMLTRRAIADILRKDPEAIPDGEKISPMQLVVWLVERMRACDFRPATWRQYKASILYSLSTIRHDDNADAYEYLKSLEYKPHKLVAIPKRTSAKKARQVSFENLEKIFSWLISRNREYYHLTAMWMIASYNTGLRPCEWERAIIVDLDGLPYLKAVNAKNTHGRSHGEFRHVPLVHLDSKVQEIIKNFLNALAEIRERENAQDFETVKTKVRMIMNRASRSVLDKRYKGVSLYTMRHQFSANAKATLGARHAGALMGHAIDETCTEHYARTQYGQVIHGLVALPEEVERVRVTGKVGKRRESETALDK